MNSLAAAALYETGGALSVRWIGALIERFQRAHFGNFVNYERKQRLSVSPPLRSNYFRGERERARLQRPGALPSGFRPDVRVSSACAGGNDARALSEWRNCFQFASDDDVAARRRGVSFVVSWNRALHYI